MIESDRYVTVMLKVSRKAKRNPKHEEKTSGHYEL